MKVEEELEALHKKELQQLAKNNQEDASDVVDMGCNNKKGSGNTNKSFSKRLFTMVLSGIVLSLAWYLITRLFTDRWPQDASLRRREYLMSHVLEPHYNKLAVHHMKGGEDTEELLQDQKESWAFLFQEDSNSPQAKALDWMVHDDDFSSKPRTRSLRVLLERYALAVLYFSTDGPHWTTKDHVHFLDGTKSHCKWHRNDAGVYCSRTPWWRPFSGHPSVKDLWVMDMNLQGTIPRELSFLGHLKSLTMTNNALTGTIPSELGMYMSKLQDLVLDENELYGSIPTQLPTALEYMNLGGNHLTGTLPTEWPSMPRLTSLTLSGNRIHGSIPSEWGGEHQKLQRLQYLNLMRNDLSGTIPSTIGLMTNLRSLDISHNQLIGTLPLEIGNLKKMGGLSLHNNPGLTGAVPKVYGTALSFMYEFDLFNTSLTGSLDELFCDKNSDLFLYADCLGEEPRMECSCCFFCCNANGDTCEYQNVTFPV